MLECIVGLCYSYDHDYEHVDENKIVVKQLTIMTRPDFKLQQSFKCIAISQLERIFKQNN